MSGSFEGTAFLGGLLIGLVAGIVVGGGLEKRNQTEPLRKQCIAEKTAACREANATDTGAYLECVKPVKERCSP